MLKTLPEPRKDMSPYAPRVESIHINPDKIRDVIGKGGETINKIYRWKPVLILILKDDGMIYIASPDKTSIDATREWITMLTAEPEVGKIYEKCKVVKIMDFWCFL